MILPPIIIMKQRAEQVANAIRRERVYQDWKWGDPLKNPHSLQEWLIIMSEEMKEAFTAAEVGHQGQSLTELLQAIAVGVACIEQFGCFERDYPDEVLKILNETGLIAGIDETNRAY